MARAAARKLTEDLLCADLGLEGQEAGQRLAEQVLRQLVEGHLEG
jgi:hypothetical protein